MLKAPYAVSVPIRGSRFRSAEVTLRDGTGVRGQLAELSSRCCYIDALEPIPIRTKLRLRICDGMTTCELHGKVIYMHSAAALEFSGMGVLFEEMVPEQQSRSAHGCDKLAASWKIWERTPFQSEAKSHRISGPYCNQACL